MKNVAIKNKAILFIATIILLTIVVLVLSAFNNNIIASADSSQASETTTYKQLVYKNSFTASCDYVGKSHANQWEGDYAWDNLGGSWDSSLSSETIYEVNFLNEAGAENYSSIALNLIEFNSSDQIIRNISFGIYNFSDYMLSISTDGSTPDTYISDCGLLGDYFAVTFNSEKFFMTCYNSYIGYDTTKYEASLSNVLFSYDNTTEEYHAFKNLLTSDASIMNFYVDGKTEALDGYSFTETLKIYKDMQVPQKEGHTFVGWYYDQDFTRPYNGEAIDSDVKLYAKYEINKYTVKYDGSELDDPNDPNNVGLHDKLDIVDYGTVLDYVPESVEGKVFLGWFFEDGTKYENTPVKSDMTLIGRWKQSTCIITFDFGDHDGALDPLEVEYGSKVELPLPTSGDFKVWYWEDPKNPAWNIDEPVTSDLDLVAIWEKYIFTVTFYVDDEIWKEVKVEKGKTLGSVASDVNVDSKNVVGYENINSETVASAFAEFEVEDDVAVYCSSAPIDDNNGSGDVNIDQDNLKKSFADFWAKVKAFFVKIGQWFKNLFNKVKA